MPFMSVLSRPIWLWSSNMRLWHQEHLGSTLMYYYGFFISSKCSMTIFCFENKRGFSPHEQKSIKKKDTGRI